MKNPQFRTPLSLVRGLGSARDGTHHFIMQRVTAIALVPLSLWFVYSLIGIAGGNEMSVFLWFASGFNAVMTILLLLALFYHAKLGVQVIIEDYVHCPCMKTAALLANYFIMFAFAAVSVLAVLKLHLHI